MSNNDKVVSNAIISLNTIRTSLPANDPVTWLVDALMQIPLKDLQNKDFQAHETSEQLFDEWLANFHNESKNLSTKQIEDVRENAKEVMDLVRNRRKVLAHERGNDDDEKNIDDRFAQKLERLNQVITDVQDQEESNPDQEPQECSPDTEESNPPDENESDSDAFNSFDDYSPAPVYSPTYEGSGADHDFRFGDIFRNAFSLLLFLGMISLLPNYCTSKSKVAEAKIQHPQTIQKQFVISSRVFSDATGTSYRDLDQNSKTIAEFKHTVKPKKVPLKHRVDLPKKQQKPVVLQIKPKQEGVNYVIMRTPQIGINEFFIGEIVTDTNGCSYKVIKRGSAYQQFPYVQNIDASIYEALTNHYIKKYPTPTCMNDPRMDF